MRVASPGRVRRWRAWAASALAALCLLGGAPAQGQAPAPAPASASASASAPASASASASAPVADPVIAQSGTLTMTAAMVRQLLAAADPGLRQQAIQDPAVLEHLVRAQMLQRVLLDEARAKGWEQRPDVAFRAELAREAVIVNLYLASLTAPAAAFPSEPEIQAAYDANRKNFIVPRQYHLAQIFVALPEGAARPTEAAARAKLRELQSLLAKPAARARTEFAALARRLSDDGATAAKGGDLGWLREDELVATIRGVVSGLPGEAVSEPVRTADGWHILRLLETRPAAPAPLAEVRGEIARSLRQQRATQNERILTDDLLRRRPIQLDAIGLQHVRQP